MVKKNKKQIKKNTKPLVYAGVFIVAWTLVLAIINSPEIIERWLGNSYDGSQRIQVVAFWTWIILLLPIALSWLGASFWVSREEIRSVKSSDRWRTVVVMSTSKVLVTLSIIIAAVLVFFFVNFILHF